MATQLRISFKWFDCGFKDQNTYLCRKEGLRRSEFWLLGFIHLEVVLETQAWSSKDSLTGFKLQYVWNPWKATTSDIEAVLGLKMKCLVDISLLVGNDYDSIGVQGIGLNVAVRFAECVNKDEIQNRFLLKLA